MYYTIKQMAEMFGVTEHIHVRPRYKNASVLNDHAYIDTEFAHHYALKKESVLLDADRRTLYALMKKHFVL